MPELPEVETIRRDLQRHLSGKTLAAVLVCKPKLVRGSSGAAFARRAVGRQIRGIRRRGKLLIFRMDDPDLFLLVHLKMTGQLIYRHRHTLVGGGHGFPVVRAEELPNRTTHITFRFTDGSLLFFNDLRQFGYVQFVSGRQLASIEAAYGTEPLTAAFTPAALRRTLAGRATTLKSVLLNQSLLAGLGNIYADESCFRAKVRPTRRAGSITAAEAAALHRAIRDVLRQAIDARGTTFGNYRDGLGGEGKFISRLKVYGRAGKPCRRTVCRQTGATIIRTKISGRGTAYCPNCQR
ncbi:MAG: DNA-formamidopyrimidine glycosylase [Candidatus Andersenbacteria bacterium CG10_big_fil_rev_8_21_14_0_10_54_11]|uniref:Formamidopyrimidine-DNA glycosylase n=1 Tax=Candidatus Andersenbacteria bacterium CG10_big_fil_rev_8_21_14_0_10_54_11 TaxID=1974485 RepID=A0A2M6WYN0_9BACT|nr:MAG: DNA-formamidopyrimidine glycosylase [Candidatus Andersenbacteria bacterium CG10_big_fil_rev_8_21_14_0_10_54_11]